jgi:hypothetical protein
MGILKSYILGEASPVEKLNQLKYGQGEGPIVKKRIPTSINDNGPKSNELTRRADDLKRIALMFTKANGIKYLANETFLNSLESEASSKRKTAIGKKLSQLSKGLLTTAKIVGSTLLQVPFNGTGTHFVRGFNKDSRRTFPNSLIADDITGVWQAKFSEAQQLMRDSLKTAQGLPLNDIMPITSELIAKPLQSDISTLTTDLGAKQYIDYDSTLFKKTQKDVRVKLGKVDQRVNRSNYANPDEFGIYSDLINRLELYKSPNQAGIDKTRDLIKFRFAVLTPDDTTYLHFRAFLKEFNDNYSGNWNKFNYIGRAESFYTYENFDRSFSFSFTIAAQTRDEMAPLYRKIVYLASSTAPTYSDAGYMRGTLTRITIGDYFRELPGIIESVTYSWRDGYPWEITLNNPESVEEGEEGPDIDMQELPMVLDCTINFKPIHKFTPETGLKHFITTDIAPSNKSLFFNSSGKILVNGEPKDIPTAASVSDNTKPVSVE